MRIGIYHVINKEGRPQARACLAMFIVEGYADWDSIPLDDCFDIIEKVTNIPRDLYWCSFPIKRAHDYVDYRSQLYGQITREIAAQIPEIAHKIIMENTEKWSHWTIS